jgi:hypothetical protein
MPDYRSPILEYATFNPVPPFYESEPTTKYLVTESGALFVTEEGYAIEIEE